MRELPICEKIWQELVSARPLLCEAFLYKISNFNLMATHEVGLSGPF